jgi:membrane-associated phospholipid phosphatase
LTLRENAEPEKHGPGETAGPTGPRRAAQPTRGRWLADLLGARAKLISGLLVGALVIVIVDIFIQGPLTQLDKEVYDLRGRRRWPELTDAAWIYDKMGQRSVLVPILLLVAGIFARRHRTWRPVVLAVVSFVVLNVVVGAMKILIGRAETESGSVDVLAGGIIFPSGHASNMVLTGGLIVYLFWLYAEDPPLRRLTGLVAVLTTVTCVTSLFLGTHWLTDLIAGLLVGGLLLQLVILFDRATANIRREPVHLFGRDWSLPEWLQHDGHSPGRGRHWSRHR